MKVIDPIDYAEAREWILRTIAGMQAEWLEYMRRLHELENGADSPYADRNYEIKFCKEMIDCNVGLVRTLKSYWRGVQKKHSYPTDFTPDTLIIEGREASQAIGKLDEFERRLAKDPAYALKIVKDLYLEAGLKF